MGQSTINKDVMCKEKKDIMTKMTSLAGKM